jgi:hypothetical protein
MSLSSESNRTTLPTPCIGRYPFLHRSATHMLDETACTHPIGNRQEPYTSDSSSLLVHHFLEPPQRLDVLL